jgi:pilus assembly protein Flp/PilA
MIEYFKAVLARRREDQGASGVEYGLLVAAIAAVIVGLAFAIGVFVKNGFQDTCDELQANSTGPATQTCP